MLSAPRRMSVKRTQRDDQAVTRKGEVIELRDKRICYDENFEGRLGHSLSAKKR